MISARGGIDELSGGNNNDTIDALGSDDRVIAGGFDGVNINDCEQITKSSIRRAA